MMSLAHGQSMEFAARNAMQGKRKKKKKKDLKEKERTEKHRENKQTNEPKQLGFKNEPPQ